MKWLLDTLNMGPDAFIVVSGCAYAMCAIATLSFLYWKYGKNVAQRVLPCSKPAIFLALGSYALLRFLTETAPEQSHEELNDPFMLGIAILIFNSDAVLHMFVTWHENRKSQTEITRMETLRKH